jgi:iron-sulfur cluster insertion protein
MIQITESAANKVRQMITAQGKSGMNLRLYVEGGGCSGMQYGLTFDGAVSDDDEQIECDGFKVVVDPMSLPFLQGARVDYLDTLMESGFKIQNPQAKTTCGCGQSFGA